MAAPIQKTEAEWQAESDARTIMEADIIRNDEKRFPEAQKAAKRMAEEKQEEIKALKSLSEVEGVFEKSPKSPTGK